MSPLNGLLVLDFGTLLPGPLASLMLAEAGARVVKVERPDGGDEMRGYVPKVDGVDSAPYHILNRGKESLALDLKDPAGFAALRPWLENADILIDQFRPGVMKRLGLDYEAVRAINPRLIYCSITGWGQEGPSAQRAAHDLNFLAESGLANRTHGADGNPALPPALIADIAGGSMPAVINILLALLQRGRTGEGCYLDIAMCDILPMFAYADLSEGSVTNQWPGPNQGLTNGHSPRYQLYRTRDGRHIAAAPLEDRFWANFCAIIGLPAALRDAGDERAAEVRGAVAAIIAGRDLADWMEAFGDADVCCSVVRSLSDLPDHAHLKARGVFDRKVELPGVSMPALPLPVARIFRSAHALEPAPRLGSVKDVPVPGRVA